MRQSGTGKRALLHSWQTNCGQNDEDKEARSWYVDETYVNVKGKWCYLYRAIDRDGNLVDSIVSEKRDMEAAKRFFKQAVDVVGHAPERVTTDGHDSYPRAIRETLGNAVLHRTNPYLNNRLEQDHRGIRTALLPHAWIRKCYFSSTLLPCIRCAYVSSFGFAQR